MQDKKIIISGGGTGGHIFPAISIANAIKANYPQSSILFVGAEGKMEMNIVPNAGYEIIGLPVRGFHRGMTLKNIGVIINLIKSMIKSRNIIKKYKPNIVVGVGGYASGPICKSAINSGIPVLIQEQNSYAGVTNKLLGRKATKICVAYDGMDRFFPEDKIILTGNPIRKDLNKNLNIGESFKYFGLEEGRKTILILGGSQGAGTINNAMASIVSKYGGNPEIQILWQCGKFYYESLKTKYSDINDNIRIKPFLDRMDMAYAISDIVISRAGAGTISELCLLGKASILIPSPNVAEDHQTKNAMALVEKGAAEMIRDKDAETALLSKLSELIENSSRRNNLSDNISKLGILDSDERIVKEIFQILSK